MLYLFGISAPDLESWNLLQSQFPKLEVDPRQLLVQELGLASYFWTPDPNYTIGTSCITRTCLFWGGGNNYPKITLTLTPLNCVGINFRVC